MAKEKAIVLQDFGDSSSVFEVTSDGNDFQIRETRIPIETFPYGFLHGASFYVSGSNSDKRVFELINGGVSENTSKISDRLARSYQGKVDQVLFMDDKVTALISADYSNYSVTFSLVDVAGNKIRRHVLDLRTGH